MSLKSWASGLVVAALVAGCGGDGGSSSTPVSISITPTSATLSASTTDVAPTTTLSLSTLEGPQGRLTVVTTNGSKGYANASFNGTAVVVTGESPASLAAGTYQDSITVKVCYDAQCAQQVTNSPLTVPVSYTVTQGNPAVATPAITGLSPTSVSVGSGAFTLTVSGNNFTSGSTVMWNGQARATTYVAAATLNAQITASDVAAISKASVTVSNAASGGGVSAAQSFSVAAAVPAITSLSPATAFTGGSAYTLTVNGTGFDSSAQVSWNGSPMVTTFVSATQVTAVVPATDIAASGSFPVTVWNSDGSASASSPMSVTVSPAPLVLTTLTPSFVSAGGTAYSETLTGSGFTRSSTALWNGNARPTSYVSSTELVMTVSASDIANVGTASVSVTSGTATPTTSGTQTLSIVASTAAVDATAFQVNPQHNAAQHFNNIVASTALPTSATWTASLGGTVSYPLIAAGRVFVTVGSTGVSKLYALNASTGAVLWGPISMAGTAGATYDSGRVIVLTNTGHLSAYDAGTGTQVWTTTLTGQFSFEAAPTALNGVVYTIAGGSAGTVYAYNDTNGALLWTQGIATAAASSPAVSATGVYVSISCSTYDFTPSTGARIWLESTGCTGGGGQTGTLANGVYYSANDTGTGAFDGMSYDAGAGTLLSSYRASQPPVFSSTTGYFYLPDTLNAVRLSDNSALWSFTGDGTLLTGAVLVNNYVFVGSNSGKLYILDAATGAQLGVVSLGAAPNFSSQLSVFQSTMSAGDGLLVVPVGNTLQAFTLSTNP